MNKVIFLISALSLLSACQTYENLRSRPPACNSAKYSHFMGQTKDWVLAQNIPERWKFVGASEPDIGADPTRIAFFLEGNPEKVSGIGCN